MKNDITYEYRKFVKRPNLTMGDLEIGECTYNVLMKELKKPYNGRLYHTTDTNQFFYDWNNKRYELNWLGKSSSIDDDTLNKALAGIKADIAKLKEKTYGLTDDDRTLLNNVFNLLQNFPITEIKEAADKINGFDDTVTAAKSEIATAKTNAVKAVNTASTNAVDAVDSAKDSAIATINTQVDTAITNADIPGKVDDAITNVDIDSLARKAVADAVADEDSDIDYMVNDAIEKANIDALAKTAVEKAVEEEDSDIDYMVNDAIEKADIDSIAKAKVKSAVEDPDGDFQKAVSDAKTSIDDKVSEGESSIEKAVADAVSDADSDIDEYTEQKLQEIKNAIDEGESDIDSYVEQKLQEIQNAIDEGESDIDELVDNLKEELRNYVDEGESDIDDAVQAGLDKIQDLIDSFNPSSSEYITRDEADSDYDPIGSADAVLGTEEDDSDDITVYGTRAYAKSYADSLADNYMPNVYGHLSSYDDDSDDSDFEEGPVSASEMDAVVKELKAEIASKASGSGETSSNKISVYSYVENPCRTIVYDVEVAELTESELTDVEGFSGTSYTGKIIDTYFNGKENPTFGFMIGVNVPVDYNAAIMYLDTSSTPNIWKPYPITEKTVLDRKSVIHNSTTALSGSNTSIKIIIYK